MADELTGQAKDDLLKEIRDHLTLCISLEGDERREAQECFSFVYGNQWPQDMARMREVEKRPALTNNRLPAFVHQVVNDLRQNRPGIKVHPVDSGADVETAEVLQGIIRHTEYASNADFAYDTAVSHAVIGGYGWFRLLTEYCDETSFDQEAKFARIPNPFTVYRDPYSTEPDGSDQTRCLITEMVSRGDFKAKYPKASAATAEGLIAGTGDSSATWLSQDSVRVAEYYRVETESLKLYRLQDGGSVWEDEVNEGVLPYLMTDDAGKPVSRMSDRRKVCWYKVTGLDILEQAEIPCRWIPVFPVYGEEHIVNGVIRRCGMVKHAIDPMRMFNFWTTSATEEVSLRPKTPFIGAVGQFETAKKDWRQANTRSFSFLEYDQVSVDGIQAPPPQRQQMADVPTGAIQMIALAEGNIKATMGLFDASLGNRGNATSGRQELAQQREGDTATFHFGDNLTRTIRHVGRCLVDIIPRIFDTQRVARILGEDEKMKMAEVNKPMEQPEHTESGGIRTVLNDLSVGKYDATISSGPSYATKRQEQAEAMLQVGQAAPQLWATAGDLLIRNMDWNGAEEIADRYKRSIPREIVGEEDGEQQQLPPQVQQVLQQAQGEIQQLQQALQEAQSGMAVKQLETDSRERMAAAAEETKRYVAELNADVKHDVAELAGMVQLMLQKMQPPPQLAAEVSADMNESGDSTESSYVSTP